MTATASNRSQKCWGRRPQLPSDYCCWNRKADYYYCCMLPDYGDI